MLTPSRHVRGQHGPRIHVPASSGSRQLSEIYLRSPEHWLRDLSIPINVSKNIAQTARRFQNKKPVHFLKSQCTARWDDPRRGSPRQVTLATYEERQGNGWACRPALDRRCCLFIGNFVPLCKKLIPPTKDFACPI
jgi:hypothetical protein